jgi:HEPN domain-containing protein/predicted nucleotidyltransferase
MRARRANVDSILDDLTEVLVERFHPDSVILFGSRARGDARDDSDYDLAVVVDRERKRELRMAMEAAAREATGASVDIHLRRPGDIDDLAADPGYIDWDILREGVTLYTSPSHPGRVREPRPRRSSVVAWHKMASVDLVMIENSLRGPEVPWAGIAFHAQQAAEKYLKAAIIARGVRPQRTHSLIKLFDHLVALDPSLPNLRVECQLLTPFAVITRYPDDDPDEEAEEAPPDVDGETGERAVAAMRAIVAATAKPGQ